MSQAWLHADPLPSVDEGVTLDAEEARHAGSARRLAAGDPVTLFDGRGGLAHAVLDEGTTRKTVSVRVSRVEALPARRPALRLGTALPKGDRQATLVSMATQLGVAAWAPLRCERSVARPGRNADERWRRVAIAACKQSRNAWLPELLPEADPARFADAEARRGACFVLHPGAGSRPIAEAARESLTGAPASLTVVVGPEGGLEEEEVRACEARGAVRVSLGETILRTETAAVAALAVLRSLAPLS